MKKFVITVVLILIGLAIIGSCMEEKTGNKTETANKVKDASEEDRAAFLKFHKELMKKTSVFDEIYRPFTTKLGDKDVFGALKEAIKIKQVVDSMWSEIYALKSPKLDNKESRESLKEGKERLSSAYLYKATLVSDFIKFSENGSNKQLAELSNNSEKITPLLAEGIALIYSSAEKIGIDPKTLQNK